MQGWRQKLETQPRCLWRHKDFSLHREVLENPGTSNTSVQGCLLNGENKIPDFYPESWELILLMMWLPSLSVVADLTQNHPEWIFQTLPPLTLVFNFQLVVPIFRGDNLLNSMLSQSEMTTDSRPLSYETHLLSHMYFSKEFLFRYTIRYIVLGLGMTFPNSFVFVYANNKPTIIRLFRSLMKPDYIKINHAFILRSSSFVSLLHDTCKYT